MLFTLVIHLFFTLEFVPFLCCNFRFKIPIKVEDCTGVVSLTMFDWEAKKFLKQTAKELLDKYVEGGCNEIYPDELNSLVGKKFAFNIEVSNYNVEYKYKSFGITKITHDVAILSTLEKNFIDHQVISYKYSFTNATYSILN
ncbi:putative nucleic acid-binding protein [Helianthus anomalus]